MILMHICPIAMHRLCHIYQVRMWQNIYTEYTCLRIGHGLWLSTEESLWFMASIHYGTTPVWQLEYSKYNSHGDWCAQNGQKCSTGWHFPVVTGLWRVAGNCNWLNTIFDALQFTIFVVEHVAQNPSWPTRFPNKQAFTSLSERLYSVSDCKPCIHCMTAVT